MKTAALLQARSVSRRVGEYLSQPRAGDVLATFRRSCYLDVDGQIVALVAAGLLNGPLNVVVDADTWSDRVAVGARVRITGRVLRIDGGPGIELQHAVVWDATLRRWPSGDAAMLLEHTQLLGQLLAAEAPAGGLARVALSQRAPPAGTTPLEAQAVPAVAMLPDGLRSRSPTQLSDAAGRLAGLGPGLTPSGDDVLVGCLLALAVVPGDNTHLMRAAIVSAARDRTTRISLAYLDAAAQGEAGEAWHGLTDALAMNATGRITHAARQIMAFGETSGSDMLAGFVVAVQALL